MILHKLHSERLISEFSFASKVGYCRRQAVTRYDAETVSSGYQYVLTAEAAACPRHEFCRPIERAIRQIVQLLQAAARTKCRLGGISRLLSDSTLPRNDSRRRPRHVVTRPRRKGSLLAYSSASNSASCSAIISSLQCKVSRNSLRAARRASPSTLGNSGFS